MKKRSWDSNTIRKDTNKYNCQKCKKDQEKTRRLKQMKKDILKLKKLEDCE